MSMRSYEHYRATWTDVQKLEIIGKGAYGAVYRGRHLPSGHVVALKIINLDTEDDDVGDIQKEIALLQQLMNTGGGRDMNVIKYYGSLMEGPRVWIIMELAEGGSIRTLVRLNSDSGYAWFAYLYLSPGPSR
jgi:protein-serine/threonine kinase